MINIAIYSRKSKFTGTGDSVENQVQICKEHLNYLYRDKEYSITIYEDEGFSGKNIKRPMFQTLLDDIKKGKMNVLICYRLDRVSRSVADFSQLLDLLQQHGVEFISVKENFDTSTPMGRAMISIASVFAQLERETIAERVKDNKILIAKTGRWQGGTPPLGYTVEKSIYTDDEGKKRSSWFLKEDTASQLFKDVGKIFGLFIQHKSIVKVESELMKAQILTPQDKEYSTTVIKQILSNPVYASNDIAVYDYLIKCGCTVANSRDEFDGKHGLMGYGKTGESTNRKRQRNEKDKWIISIGTHSGIIKGEDWVDIQKIIEINGAKFPRFQTSDVALFSGMIKCTCGAPMLVKGNRPDRYGNPSYYYKCYRKDRSHGEICSTTNIKGPTFDDAVVTKIKDLSSLSGVIGNDASISIKKLAQTKSELEKNIFKAKKSIEEKELSIEQLVMRLTDATLPQNVLKQIEITLTKLSNDLDQLKNEILNNNHKIDSLKSDKENLELIISRINDFSNLPEDALVSDKRNMLKTIVKEIQWDGTNFDVVLFTDVITGG